MKIRTGLAIASTAALLFTAGCATQSSDSNQAPGHAMKANGCKGVNSCKGKSACKGKSGCKGGGSCKSGVKK